VRGRTQKTVDRLIVHWPAALLRNREAVEPLVRRVLIVACAVYTTSQSIEVLFCWRLLTVTVTSTM
jgi:hypothetical protein